MRILEQARGYLSFRDLCATRPVCSEWMDLRSIPHAHPVYFFEDGSNVNLPNSSDPNFRRALLAATLHDFHCEIFNQDQLQFALQIFPNVRNLTIELDGRNGDELRPGEMVPQWQPNTLSVAQNARKIELAVSNFQGEIQVDFSALANLVHFESDTAVRFANFDNRNMACFGYKCDFWNENATEIALQTKVLRISRNTNIPDAYMRFSDSWTQTSSKPNVLEANIAGLTFFSLTREYMMVHPVFTLPEAQYESFVAEYRVALEQLLDRMPGHPLRFHEGCTNEMKSIWLSIINPIRAQYGLPTIEQNGTQN